MFSHCWLVYQGWWRMCLNILQYTPQKTLIVLKNMIFVSVCLYFNNLFEACALILRHIGVNKVIRTTHQSCVSALLYKTLYMHSSISSIHPRWIASSALCIFCGLPPTVTVTGAAIILVGVGRPKCVHGVSHCCRPGSAAQGHLDTDRWPLPVPAT